MWSTVGSCPKCGAPVYTPTTWMGTIPPMSRPSCMCNAPIQQHVTSTSINKPLYNPHYPDPPPETDVKPNTGVQEPIQVTIKIIHHKQKGDDHPNSKTIQIWMNDILVCPSFTSYHGVNEDNLIHTMHWFANKMVKMVGGDCCTVEETVEE